MAGMLYMATDRLKNLFSGITGIKLVDDIAMPLFRGEEVRKLLEACGAVRYLRPKEDASLSPCCLRITAPRRSLAAMMQRSAGKSRSRHQATLWKPVTMARRAGRRR